MSYGMFWIIVGLLALGGIALAVFKFNYFLITLGVGVILYMLTFGARALIEGDVGVWTYKAIQMIVCGGLPIYFGIRRIRNRDKKKREVNPMSSDKGVNKLREPFVKFIETELEFGFLLIACGLPGTWKTETTEEVARIKGYPLLRSDLIRLEVLKNEDIFDEKVASNMDKRTMVYDEMFRQADEALNKGDGVLLDATFITQLLRRQAAAIAAKHNRMFVILQTDCPQEVSIARILRRTKEDYESNALTEQAYLNNKKRFEEVNLDDLKNLYPNLSITHLTVDTRYDQPEEWYIVGIERR